MMKFVTNIPIRSVLREFFFVGKYAAALQMLFALCLGLWSRLGGPLGCVAYAEALAAAGLITLTLTLSLRILVSRMLRSGFDLN